MDGFERAQAAYDTQEPPEEPICPICNNEGKVEVAVIVGCEGQECRWPEEKFGSRPEVDCPFCN